MQGMKLSFFSTTRPVLPAMLVFVTLGALWLYARFGYLPGHGPEVTVLLFTGWLALMFLLSTVAVVIWTACVDTRPRAGPARRTFLAYSLVSDLCGLLLLIVGVAGGLLSLLDVLRIYALLIAWLGLWTSAAGALRRLGSGVAVVASLSLAMSFFAAPVIASPIARASAQWSLHNTPAQPYVVQGIGYVTPMLALLDAVKDSFRIGWAQLPLMYHLTPLGQDIPMPLPTWWITTLAFAGAAVLLWTARRPWKSAPL